MARDACATIETVRASIWKTGKRPPPWMDKLVDDVCKEMGVEWMRPELAVTKVACDTTFGGSTSSATSPAGRSGATRPESTTRSSTRSSSGSTRSGA